MLNESCPSQAGQNSPQETQATNPRAESVAAITTVAIRIPLFSMGQTVATPPAIATMKEHGITARELLRRHVTGDWEEMNAENAALNRLSVTTGGRIFSAFVRDNVTIWVITEADCSPTCMLLPLMLLTTAILTMAATRKGRCECP